MRSHRMDCVHRSVIEPKLLEGRLWEKTWQRRTTSRGGPGKRFTLEMHKVQLLSQG